MHQFDTLPRQCRHIEHMHEAFWLKNIYYCQNDSYENLDNFLPFIELGYACAMIVHSWANQFLPQILMDQFDTMPTQCRHIEHMHEVLKFKKKIIDKMTALRT